MTAEELGQMIWNVKELLRNVYDNKDVEDVILPFTLLRRLDCVLVGSEALVATNMKQLEADAHGCCRLQILQHEWSVTL